MRRFRSEHSIDRDIRLNSPAIKAANQLAAAAAAAANGGGGAATAHITGQHSSI